MRKYTHQKNGPKECDIISKETTSPISNRSYRAKQYPLAKDGTQKNSKSRQDIIWGAGPSAIKIITKGELITYPDSIKTDNLPQLFREHHMPTRNTNRSCGNFCLGKARRKRNTRSPLEKTSTAREELRISK